MLGRRDSLELQSLPSPKLELEPALPTGSGAQPERPLREMVARYGVWILLVWIVSAIVSLAVEPNYDNASNAELIYYTIYNVAIGSFVGLYLPERISRGGWTLSVLRACAAIITGTLINELVIEPSVFGTGFINAEGVYYGLVEALTTSGIFLLLRIALCLRALQQQVEAATAGILHPRADEAPPEGDNEESNCFFVRVAGESRRIFPADLLYMEAEKDFTRIVCTNGEHFVSESLKSLLQKSSRHGIARIHKSFAVNLQRVEKLTRTEALLGEIRVPVGRKYWEEFSPAWKTQPPASPSTQPKRAQNSAGELSP